jgi:hypothetical protein
MQSSGGGERKTVRGDKRKQHKMKRGRGEKKGMQKKKL